MEEETLKYSTFIFLVVFQSRLKEMNIPPLTCRVGCLQQEATLQHSAGESEICLTSFFFFLFLFCFVSGCSSKSISVKLLAAAFVEKDGNIGNFFGTFPVFFFFFRYIRTVSGDKAVECQCT